MHDEDETPESDSAPENGKGRDPVILLTVPTSFEAEIIKASLDAAGIEAQALTTLYDIDGPMSLASETPGVPVLVPRNQAQTAREHLEKIRNESLDIDWDKIDVGDQEEAENALKKAGYIGRLPAPLFFLLIFSALILISIAVQAIYSKS